MRVFQISEMVCDAKMLGSHRFNASHSVGRHELLEEESRLSFSACWSKISSWTASTVDGAMSGLLCHCAPRGILHQVQSTGFYPLCNLPIKGPFSAA